MVQVAQMGYSRLPLVDNAQAQKYSTTGRC
jgi:hypothetical protein